ncbi:MAG: hypothetical protein GY760_18770 [Deltaproteobacteria bacterium]|nr:hypothetical protein [Deltaproteobacteria bacterium]
MSVFTIFNHGTDFHRDKQASEVISLLSQSMKGKEALIIKDEKLPLGYRLKNRNPNFLICEGPGSEAITGEESPSGVEHTWPGKDNPITRDQAKDSLVKQQKALKKDSLFSSNHKKFQNSFYGNTEQPWKWQGQVSGAGWNDNVYKAVWILTHLLFSENQAIDTVNIIGWSRGAVTCLKQAYLLNEVLPQLKVNILAFDPVPGKDPADHEADTRTITKNVKTYWAVLALNERRMNFRCVDPGYIVNKSPDSWVEFLPMPGNHSDVARPNKDVQKSLQLIEKKEGLFIPMSYKIAVNLGHRFLTHFGTPLNVVDQPKDIECLTFYNDMQKRYAEIKKQYDACESWTDISTPRLGWRYNIRAIAEKHATAQKKAPQKGMKTDNYSPFALYKWMNAHHWILAKNSGKPCADLDHSFVNVSEDRIGKWEAFLGV